VTRSCVKPLARAALLIIAGAGLLFCARAQQPSTGSLAGRLTDLHSVPLEDVAVTLRNATTGAEQQAKTSRSGSYHFEGLPEGEYTVTAVDATGIGRVEGIYVAAGHEARVQTAIELKIESAVDSENRTSPQMIAADAGLQLRTWQVARAITPPIQQTVQPLPETQIAVQGLYSLPLPGIPAKSAERSSAGPITGGREEEAVADASLGVRISSAIAQPAGEAQVESARTSAQSLDASQLQALPLAGRNWRNFVFDAPAQSGASDDEQGTRNSAGAGPGITVDGARIQLAFGSSGGRLPRVAGTSLIGPTSGDSAVREVQIDESAGAGGNRTNVETQHGTEQLHGQAFLFDRQNMLGARNPFTQWVQETAPATHTTVPAFTPLAFSPGDREALWGLGVGGMLHKQRLLWFAALDGIERNDPAISTVKHPDTFFAQPTNDQMQLLSAQLGIASADPVSAGLGAYSKLLESLAGLLGPSPRSTSQWTGFGRIDWKAAERHRFTFEWSAVRLNSSGGGFSRASETYGTHSFGSMDATEQWGLGRWEAFLTPNLLAVSQGSFGHQVQSAMPERPSQFEQSLNINAWGQLPQIVVDSRYGFTIGNPARFGRGSYPDEQLYLAQQQLNWVHGQLMVKSGVELSHNRDATSRLRNQTGTYYYATIENFASDALAFSSFGLSGQLNPMDQHNCDQRGKAWRDTAGQLHGLGYLPCYSYYSQTMGPANWWLSTNDWAGYVTSQWQPGKRTALTLAMRWELEQLPRAIPTLQNVDLPLTQHLPALGNQWGPRAAFAWGTGENHWPVLRLGYGMYFARTRNAVVESALTQTGSLKGDLNFFVRPTDNLNAGDAPPFPYVFQGEPASVVKPGAVEFGPNFRNGEVHQAEAAVEESLPGRVHVEASAVVSLGRRLPVTIDANIDPAVNPKTIAYAMMDGNGSGPIKTPQITVPFYASWPSSTGSQGRLNPNYQQVSELFSRANSTYEAAIFRLSRSMHPLTVRARYTYAHAMDWNPDETSQVGGPSVLDPTDFREEYGTSSLDVRHSTSVAMILEPRWKLKELVGHLANGWMLSGVGYFHSGLPYTMHTAGSIAKEFDSTGSAIVGLSTGMNGYGGDNRVYGIGRNTYRYPSTWKADLRLTRRFNLGQMRRLELMAESFNLFNHQNVTELETTGYTIESGTVNGGMPRLNFLTGLKTGQTEFGKPLNINATDFYRERQIQFGARMRF
jgi:hypothetical protein